MNAHMKGGMIALVCGVALLIGIYFLTSLFQTRQQHSTSDAGSIVGRVSIGYDNWIGYFPLCSPEMVKRMRGARWELRCIEDAADYATRIRQLRDGELQFAVATVDSNILNSAPLDFPGVMVMVIDESGGDAIVAWPDKVKSLDDVRGKTDLRVAFTPFSPSHHLNKAAVIHFGVKELLPNDSRRIETDGSTGALKKLLAHEADVATLWEPDVSRALKHGAVKLLGSEETAGLIVDVLLVSRDFSEENPDAVTLLLSNYFSTLKKYRENPDFLKKHVSQKLAEDSSTKFTDADIESMLKGVRFVNFTENCEKWFGVCSYNYGLIETIDSTVRILVESGDFPSNPIPDENPYLLVQSSFLETIHKQGVETFAVLGTKGVSKSANVDSLATPFAKLNASQWDSLRLVGTLEMKNIVFSSGSNELTTFEKAKIDAAVATLKLYPRYRLVIGGHTSTSGDKAANEALSRDRADSVARYLKVTYGIDKNRLRVVGYGGERPLPRKPGESSRTHKYRLPRVELTAVSEVY